MDAAAGFVYTPMMNTEHDSMLDRIEQRAVEMAELRHSRDELLAQFNRIARKVTEVHDKPEEISGRPLADIVLELLDKVPHG